MRHGTSKTTALLAAIATGALLCAVACGGDDASGGGGGGAGTGGAAGGGGAAGAGGSGGGSCIDTGEQALPRGEAFAVHDPKRNRVVFFGGDVGVPQQCNPAPKPDGELWTYDVACKTFKKVDAGAGPGARTRGLAIHDPEGDRMIVFGGRFRAASSGPYTVYSDVWALNLESMTWQEIATTGGGPSARSSVAGAYDPATKELLLFGGNASTSGLSFTPLSDVWALNLATGAWREIVATGVKPEARLFHSVTLDAASSRLYVYAGGGVGAFQGPFMADLWSLDTKTSAWTSEHDGASSAPMGRIHTSLTWDAQAKRLVMFGGHDDGAVGNNNDTWSFDPGTKQWTAHVPAEVVNTPAPSFCLFPPDFTVPNLAAPDRRSAHVAVLDTAGGGWFVYGGKTDCGNINDVWRYDLGSNAWQNQVPATIGEACPRGKNPGQCSTLCI
jgi:hypothetical protein